MKSLNRTELDSLLTVARKHSEHDWLMLCVTFSHGLRASETISLDRSNIVSGYLCLQRLKGSKRTFQPLLDNERDALQRLAANSEGRFFPITRQTFWRKMQTYGIEAGLPEFKRHPHVLRHSTGRLGFIGGMAIPDIQRYLGHKSGANTLIYLESSEEESCSAFVAAVGRL